MNKSMEKRNKKEEIEKAIFECYGKKAFEENKQIRVDEEVITSWWIEGFDTLEELRKSNFSKSNLLEIYWSGF